MVGCPEVAGKQSLIIGHCCLKSTFNALPKQIRFCTTLGQSLMWVCVWCEEPWSHGSTLASKESGKADSLALPWQVPLVKGKAPNKYRKCGRGPAPGKSQTRESAFQRWECQVLHCNAYADHSVLFIGSDVGTSGFLWV